VTVRTRSLRVILYARAVRILVIAILFGTTLAAADDAPLDDPALELLVTPSPDHKAFVDAIDGARTSVDMAMFHLTDTQVIEALVKAAKRHVPVRVILDGASLKDPKLGRVQTKLRDGGVDVHASSAGFSITHEKAMVIDRTTAFITAINLTKPVATTRDFGIVTHAKSIIEEVERVFEADLANATTGTATTPELHVSSLVWSPVDSRAKLVALIERATKTLDVTVENLGDPAIAEAMIKAAKRKVSVRLIVPACDKNEDPHHNFPPAAKLAKGGVDVRAMLAPETATRPYMHSKMILADGAIAYVGSVNFSTNSTTKARELGVIFANPAAATTIAKTFDEDWRRAVALPDPAPACPKDN
jgi:phosphatidylserine/phosphatidylglycerophosphate/cardiolipin synthase-like enzyme